MPVTEGKCHQLFPAPGITAEQSDSSGKAELACALSRGAQERGLMGELGEAQQALLCPYYFWAVTQLCSCFTQVVSPAGTAEPCWNSRARDNCGAHPRRRKRWGRRRRRGNSPAPKIYFRSA